MHANTLTARSLVRVAAREKLVQLDERSWTDKMKRDPKLRRLTFRTSSRDGKLAPDVAKRINELLVQAGFEPSAADSTAKDWQWGTHPASYIRVTAVMEEV